MNTDLSFQKPQKRQIDKKSISMTKITTQDRNLSVSYDKLYKQFQKINEKHDEMMNEQKILKAKIDLQDKELVKSKKTVERAVQDKYEMEEKLNESKVCIRKLENKIGLVLRGNGDNAKTEKLFSIREDKERLQDENKELKDNVERLRDHVIVLSKALELKSDELCLTGDMKSSLLYDVGQCRLDIERSLEREEKTLEDKEKIQLRLQAALATIEELKNIRDSNGQELQKLENKMIELKNTKEKLMEKNKDLSEEKLSLLEYIDELLSKKPHENQVKNAKHKKNLVDLEHKLGEKEVYLEDLSLKYEQALDTIKELDNEITRLRKNLSCLIGDQEEINQKEMVFYN